MFVVKKQRQKKNIAAETVELFPRLIEASIALRCFNTCESRESSEAYPTIWSCYANLIIIIIHFLRN